MKIKEVKNYNMDKWWIFSILFWLRLVTIILGCLIVVLYERV